MKIKINVFFNFETIESGSKFNTFFRWWKSAILAMAGLVFVTLGLSWLLCCCTQAQPPPLDAICDSNGRCTWHGSGWYRGCVSDIPVLTFNQFNDGGLLDLRCSEVQVLSIESSTLTCADMKAHVITHTAVTIYLGESQTECVRLVINIVLK